VLATPGAELAGGSTATRQTPPGQSNLFMPHDKKSDKRDKVKGRAYGTGTTEPQTVPVNGWYVLLELVRLFSMLVRTGNIIGLIVCIGSLWLLLLTYKASVNATDQVLLGLYSFLGAEKFYVLPLFLVILVIMVACWYRNKHQKIEIKRLAKLRHDLMHGLESGDLKPFTPHQGSGFRLD
jgi:hypothetical protein